MDYITEIFCTFDDFCKIFENNLQKSLIKPAKNTRNRTTALSLSEIMTIVVMFHQSGYRFFKYYYCNMLQMFWKSAFPTLPSYQRMIELMPRCLQALSSFFHHVKGQCTGISIIDSTKIVVCHHKRIPQHQLFKGLAQRGKSTTGWFYGFKLHLVINNLGEIIAMKLTAGNVHDVKMLASLSKHLEGILLADKGYISKALAAVLAEQGLKILTTPRQNMKHPPDYNEAEKSLLRKRGLIETVNDQLKNLHQIEHSRHRSVNNFLVNLMAAIVAYCLSPHKPHFKNSVDYGRA
ncbi:MAG: IS982 family transposase [Flavobacterium sp.]|nr:MAG: IS982 family transposase [Flavobacterium sp.]